MCLDGSLHGLVVGGIEGSGNITRILMMRSKRIFEEALEEGSLYIHICICICHIYLCTCGGMI